MLSLTLDTEAFAAKRRKAQTDLEARLADPVRAAIEADDWTSVTVLAADLLADQYQEETGLDLTRSTQRWEQRIEDTLDKGSYDTVHSVNSTALWLATAILTEATILAAIDDPEDLLLEWVDMGDKAVRETHRDVSGQVRPVGEPFDVDGVEMAGPGDVSAPMELWLNCRCTLRPQLASEFSLTAAGGTMPNHDIGIPCHGVLAPEGVWSGDKRKFAEGSLTTRPLPLPYTWQKVSADAHDGNVTVAMIEDTFTVDGLMYWEGHFLQTVPEADEFIGLVAEFGKFGTSVDADSSVFELDEDEEGIVFTSARVASACAVPIPAFHEAYIALGALPDDIRKKRPGTEAPAEAPPGTDVPEEEMLKPDDQIPTTPEGAPVDPDETDPKKRKVPAVAALEAMRARLTAPIPTLVESEAYTAKMRETVEQAADLAPGKTEDGPGWLTNPVDTDRIRDYWVSGPGAAKIGWGTPGDFNRCRTLVAEYVKPQHLNGYCANRHYDALGTWPGRGNGRHSAATEPFAAEVLDAHDNPAPAMSLVASLGHSAPASWFADPQFKVGDGRLQQIDVKVNALGVEEPVYACPLVISDTGQVYGHIASWDACHLNSLIEGGDVCVAPPRSMTGYANFLNSGVVSLDDGNQVPVGQITLGGGHAGPGLSMRAALAHYDSTSSVVCDVTIGEDDFGPWVAGWVRPGTSPEMVTAMRASAVSGDWRELRGNLELIAVLAVNSPGFGIPRTRVGVTNQRQVSLVASGIIAPSAESRQQVVEGLQQMGIDYPRLAVRIAAEMATIDANKARMAALRARVGMEE